MTPYEVIDATLGIAGRIEMQSGLFITVQLALFAGIIYVDRPLHIPEKWGAMILYGGFAAVNYRVLATQVGMLEGAYAEATRLLKAPCCVDNEILIHMTQELAEGRLSLVSGLLLLIHSLAFVLVLLSIVFDRSRGTSGPQLRQEVLS